MPNRTCALAIPLVAAALLFGCQAETDGAQPGDAEPQATGTVSPEAETLPDVPREEEVPEVNEAEPDADECGAGQLGRWLNVLPTETVREEIRETVGHDRIRYIAPGDVVTMDLRPDRLNVETGVDGRIKLFRCG